MRLIPRHITALRPPRAHAAAAAIALALTACGGDDSNLQNPGLDWPPSPAVAGHRGASALRPEHTLAAYQKAIDDGADIVEPDLVITRDGILVARHENEIGGTTNVSTATQFADRKTTKMIDGIPVTGWFTEDFTLAELKTLRAKERIPANRPANTSYDGQFEIPTLQEVIDLVKRESQSRNKVIGIYPETKHPTYFKTIGLPLEKRLVDQLVASGYRGKGAAVFLQSFEVANLKELRSMTEERACAERCTAQCSLRRGCLRQQAHLRRHGDASGPEGDRRVRGRGGAVQGSDHRAHGGQ